MEKKAGTRWVISTHTCPDIDAVAAAYFLMAYGEKEYPGISENHEFWFIKSGDERWDGADAVSNVVALDRGRGKYDHHGRRGSHTAASLVAKDLGIEGDPAIGKLLTLVELNERKGFCQFLDVGDIQKKMAHSSRLDDNQRMEMGLEITEAVIDFRQKNVERDNQWCQRLIQSFMKRREFIGPMLKKYCQQLGAEDFSRRFDLVEILSAIKQDRGAGTAREIGNKLLSVITEDERKLKQAKDLVKKANKTLTESGRIIVWGENPKHNPKFNVAARRETDAAVIIQKVPGGVQIFFDFDKVKDLERRNLVAAIRLEEQIVQQRKPVIWERVLKKGGRVRKIPEWYCFITSGKVRFLLNGSRTATEVPETQISLERLAEICETVLNYSGAFNFRVYLGKRTRQMAN